MKSFLLPALAATTLLTGVAAVAQGPARPASPPPPPGRDFFAEMDINKDGVVTRAEVTAVLEKRFAELDTDRNGVISAAEHKAAFDARREKRFNERFDAADTDKNGQLSRDELRAAHDRRADRKGPDAGPGAPPPPPPGGRPGDGDAPAGRHFDGGHGRHHGFGPGGFGKGPQGDVTKEQFMSRSLRLFDVLDSNDDGKITPAERDAARDMRDGGGPRRGEAPPRN